MREITGTSSAEASFFSTSSDGFVSERFFNSSTTESLTVVSSDIELSRVTVSSSLLIFFPAYSSAIHFDHDFAAATTG
jgi:hypothetical protein